MSARPRRDGKSQCPDEQRPREEEQHDGENNYLAPPGLVARGCAYREQRSARDQQTRYINQKRERDDACGDTHDRASPAKAGHYEPWYVGSAFKRTDVISYVVSAFRRTNRDDCPECDEAPGKKAGQEAWADGVQRPGAVVGPEYEPQSADAGEHEARKEIARF